MTMITTKDDVKLYVEEAGEGTPILFIHEFGGNHASWEPQLRFFSRRHRCITYAARGYPPSDVPDSMEAYSQALAADDAVAVLDALNAADVPIIEVHLSNIFRRESFRHHSYVSLAANGGIFGLGPQGYELALEAIASLIEVEAGETPR